MNLGVLLPLGESLTNYAKYGQDVRFVKYYLGKYSKNFDKVFVFTYENESYPGLPKNCYLICPANKLHRYLYGLALPLLHRKEYQECDVFRCFHPSATIPAIIGKIFFGKKFIFNYNYDYLEWARVEGKGYLVPFLVLQQWVAFNFCDSVFVADEKIKKYAEKFLPRSKVTIIRNGVDTASFRPLPKRKKINEKTILSVGRLETQKNYGQLIEAVSLLKTECKLFLVGRGALEKQLRSLAKKLNVKLQIIDVVPNDRLPEIYNQADVYVQPSLMEAPVKTLLEAMSCGLPCVATNVVGIRDLIFHGQNGLLTDLNAQDISQKVATVFSDRFKAGEMGLKARKMVEDKYSLFKILDIEVKTLKTI